MTPPARSLPQATESVCPVCLRRIPAEYVLDPAEEGIPSVLLRKECPEHGVFSVDVYKRQPEYLNAPDAMAPDAIEIHPGTPNTYFEQKEVKGQETAPFFADANNVVAEGSYYTQRQQMCIRDRCSSSSLPISALWRLSCSRICLFMMCVRTRASTSASWNGLVM